MRKVPRSDTRRFMILLIGRAPIPEALVVNDGGHHSPFRDYGARMSAPFSTDVR